MMLFLRFVNQNHFTMNIFVQLRNLQRMKKQRIFGWFILFVVMASALSCSKDDGYYIDRIEGEWILDRIEYRMDGRLVVLEDTAGASLSFNDDCHTKRKDEAGWCGGIQLIGSEGYPFNYYASLGAKLNMAVDYDLYERDSMPLFFLGRSNVYDIKQIEKNDLIISFSEVELDISTGMLVEDLTFYYRR